MRRIIKAVAYKIVRPLFVRDVDPNEDYECVVCGEPVLRRYLTCSEPCRAEFNKRFGDESVGCG